MGRRGPPPTPTSVLKKRRSWRANINPAEPQPPKGVPVRPDWLGPEACAAWDCLVPLLQVTGVLTPLDGPALTRYCDAWGRWVNAARFIHQHGEMYPIKDDQGRVKCFMPFPQTVTYHKLAQMLVRLEQELGLSASARTRIHASLPGVPLRSTRYYPQHDDPTPEDLRIAELKRTFFQTSPLDFGKRSSG